MPPAKPVKELAPELVGKQIVSFSELDAGRQCAYKHLLAYKERWGGGENSEALDKGTQWHALMETHYLNIKSGRKLKKSEQQILYDARTAVAKYINANIAVLEKNLDLLTYMYDGYCIAYGADPQWEILGVEYGPTYVLPNPDGGESKFALKAKIDLIVQDKNLGKIVIVDHKSCSTLPKDKDLRLDDQFALYTWLLNQAGHKVFLTIHSAARTFISTAAKPKPQTIDERFLRTNIVKPDFEIAMVAKEAYWQAESLYKLDPEKTPRSTDPERCSWRCGFTQACLEARQGTPRATAMQMYGLSQNFTRH